MKLNMPPRRRRRIALTPMVDVVMNLLFFFMIASSLVHTQAVKLPLTAGGNGAMNTATVLHVNARGPDDLLLDGQPASWADIQSRIRQQPGVHVVLSAGQALSLQSMLNLAERLRAAGAKVRMTTASP